MSLDGVFLYSIINELKSSIIDGKVDKVNQPEKDEIVLSIRQGRSTYKLLISSSSNYPRIHLTQSNKVNPLKAPMFCMVLRKYLNAAKIINIKQIDLDRVLVINFESTDELGFNSVYSLIVEIMGRHSNITLVRDRDGIIMDSIKHITPDLNTYRSVFPGIKYIYPPASNKLNPFNFNYEDAYNNTVNNQIGLNESLLSNVFTGISKVLSKEVVCKVSPNESSLSLESLDEIINLFKAKISDVEHNKFEYFLYKKDLSPIDFYCLALDNMQGYDKLPYTSPSNLLEDFYYTKDKIDRLKVQSSDLQKIITNNINRCIKKDRILTNTLIECEDKEKYRLYGELLTANIYLLEKGVNEVHLENYYSENLDKVKITLDENKTPSQNIQYYYKKYNKLKKSEESAHEQIIQNDEELKYLYSVLTNIQNVDNYKEIDEIKKELIQTGYIKFKKSSKASKSKPMNPLHYISSDGIHIYVGKNNIQNDYLTLKFANKNDTWLHTKNIPGSHVIIKAFGNIPTKTLEEAANLAAYYSKSQNSSNVPVDYTEVRNVKKPNASKPGMVIYSTNQTVYVTPTPPDLKSIAD
jgi:predicted ribosome quality control (RQC) complex YloA/Tae2 family protein